MRSARCQERRKRAKGDVGVRLLCFAGNAGRLGSRGDSTLKTRKRGKVEVSSRVVRALGCEGGKEGGRRERNPPGRPGRTTDPAQQAREKRFAAPGDASPAQGGIGQRGGMIRGKSKTLLWAVGVGWRMAG